MKCLLIEQVSRAARREWRAHRPRMLGQPSLGLGAAGLVVVAQRTGMMNMTSQIVFTLQ